MKIFFILTGLLLFMAQPALAEQYDIYLEMHQRSYHDNDTNVNRAPMLLPIEVVYASEYLLMNWGWDGRNNNVFISPGLSDSWTVGDYDYKYDKKIYYDFR